MERVIKLNGMDLSKIINKVLAEGWNPFKRKVDPLYYDIKFLIDEKLVTPDKYDRINLELITQILPQYSDYVAMSRTIEKLGYSVDLDDVSDDLLRVVLHQRRHRNFPDW